MLLTQALRPGWAMSIYPQLSYWVALRRAALIAGAHLKSMSAIPMPATRWSTFSVRRPPSHFTLSWPTRLAILSKSYLPPADSSAATAAPDESAVAKGPRASTPPPKPAFLRNDLRSCPISVSLSKVKSPQLLAAHKGRKEYASFNSPPDDSLKCGA